MGLQKINWTQIDSSNVPENVIVDIGSQSKPINAIYSENLYITGTSIGDLLINNGTFSGGTITLSSNSGNTITISGISNTDIYVTGTTFENNVLTLFRNDGISFSVNINNFSGLTVNGSISGTTFYGDGSNLTGISTENTYTTGGTYNNTEITFFNNNNTSFVVSGITGYYVTGSTFNPSNYVLTISRNENLPDIDVDLSILSSDLTITGGTYNSSNGVATFTNNLGNSFDVTGFLTGFTDTIISAVTFNNNILSIIQSDGSIKDVEINNFTGLTVNGTISGTTIYGDGGNLTNVKGILGDPEDGSFSDGLFTDISTGTTVGVFADRVNEILKSLAPSPAPPLSSLNSSSTGVNGKMSYNASALPSGYFNINGISNLTSIDNDVTYTATGNRYGIFGSSLTTISGTIASGIAAGSGTPTAAYPANSFGDADQGVLELYCNDNSTPIHTVILSSFNSGNTLNGNGSGFNLSAATSVKFPMGSNLDLFKYRTGTWTVAGSNIRNGWNYVNIIHRIGVTVRTTQYIDFFRDSVTTATSFTSESLNSLSLTGLKNISGVKYYTGGSAIYNVTINNAYRNSYSSSSSAISYGNVSTNLVVPSSEPLLSSDNDVNKSFTLTKSVNITNSGIRILNGSITLRTSVLRTVQTTQTSTGGSLSSLLVDNVNVSSTTTTENFDDEFYRLPSNLDFDDQSLVVTSSWNGANSIANTGSTGYNDGLLVYNGLLYYPNNAIVPNFSTLTNGPSSNVNYTGSNVTSERTYYRYFVKLGAANFVLNVNGTGTIRSNSYSMTNGTNDIKIDIKLPNSTGNGTGWLDVSQLFATNNWNDGAGCLQSGTFLFNTNEDLTVGTKNTSNTGNKIVIRIRVPQNWTGSINTITLT
jgi:hypothetical protein